jgi:large subunit ribosomal protein L15
VPKRGFHNIFREEFDVVNLDTLSERFEPGTEITPELLTARGLVSRKQRVKVLGRGDVTKAFTIRAHKFSGRAAEKIAAAGGTAEVLA